MWIHNHGDTPKPSQGMITFEEGKIFGIHDSLVEDQQKNTMIGDDGDQYRGNGLVIQAMVHHHDRGALMTDFAITNIYDK